MVGCRIVDEAGILNLRARSDENVIDLALLGILPLIVRPVGPSQKPGIIE